MKKNNYLIMSDNEIKDALKVFKELIKNNNIVYDEIHADPRIENCYISSSDVPGIYFPNTIFLNIIDAEKNDLINSNNKEFNCISKDAETKKIGLITSYKSDFLDGKSEKIKNVLEGFYFTPFEDLLYTWDERRAIETLSNNIEAVKKDLEILNNIKIITKKDGSPFADFKKNIDPNPKNNITINSYYDGKNLTIYYTKNSIFHYDIKLYDVRDLESLKNEIETLKANKQDYIKSLEKDIKNIKKIFRIVYDFKKGLFENASLTTRSLIQNDILQYVMAHGRIL